jgi:hypothetical protein
LEMYGARGPNMTHAVNPVSKYKKHASNAFQLPLLNDAMTCFIVDLCLIHSAQKKAANVYAPFFKMRTGWRLCLCRPVSRAAPCGLSPTGITKATYVPVRRDGLRSNEIK